MNNARYMRATVAAWLVAVSALAADPLVVEFSLVNLGVQPATNRSVIITPIILEPGPGQVAVYDRVLRNTGLSGKFYLTNLMVGMYRVTVQTPPDTTTYAIAVTTNDVGRVSADKMLVAMPTAVVRPQDYPYSAQASDRRYAPASVSTTATGWKLVEPEYAGGTNTFAPVYQLTQGNGIVVNPVTTAVGSGLYTVKTQWMELDREIVVWTNAAGDLITRSPHDEVDDIYVFTSQAGATNFDATTGWPGWGIGWQGLTNSGVLAAKWSWTTNYVLQGWGLNGQVPEDGAVLAWGAGLDYTTNGGVWTVYATNIPARSLGTSNAPSAGKVLTVDAGTNLYWGDGGGGTGQTNWPFTAITNAPWFTAGTNTLPSGVDFVLMGEAPGDDPKLVVPWQSDVPVYSTSGFKGSGEQLTHLNASNLYSGTVPLARLSGITSNQIADSTLGTNKLDANAYALLTKTGGGSGTATNLAPGLNATNLTLVKGTNTLAGTDTGWSFTGTLAGDGGRLANVPVPRNAILTNVTLVQDGGAGAAKIIVTNRTAIGGGAADQTAIWFTPSSKVSEMIFSQDSPRVHSGIMFWPNHSSVGPELIFNCQPGSLCYYYDYIQWGQPSHLGPTYEYWKSSMYSGWIDRQSGETNFWMWPGATWQFEARVRTNTGPNDVVFAGSRDLVSGGGKRPTMMFRPTSTNGSGAWIFMDDFSANWQSGLFQAVTPWGTNWHKIFRDNTYTERLRITAGPDGGLSFNGRFIVNGKEGLTTNVLAGETRLDITNGVIVGASYDNSGPVMQLTNYGVHLNSEYYVAWQTNGFIPYVPGPTNELGEPTPQNLGLTLNKGFYMASQEGLGGVFKVLWTADGTNWQSGWTNVPVTIGVSMDISEAGYQGQRGITNLTLWSWTNPELFGRSNYMHSQFLFVDRPKYPDQVAPKRTVETIANRAVREQPNWATIPAKATVNLNAQTVRHTGEWKQRVSATEQADELRWCWLGTNVWSLSAPPTVAIAVPPPNPTNDVSNGTNFILHLPDTYTPESLRVLYSHRLEPDDWRCLPSVNVATNGEVQVSFSVPDVDYGFFKVVEDSGAPVVASLKGVLEMTPRTITNSNASTWGKGAGLICVDANYIYISTGTNTWKRAALGW